MAARDEKLIDLCMARKDQSYELRQQYEDRWIRNWQWYRNTKKTKRIRNQPWTSNVMIPDAFRIVETMLPSHAMGMYNNPNWFSVEAPTAPGQTYQRAVKALLDQGWRRSDSVKKSIEAIKYAMITGHCTPKMTWNGAFPNLEIPDNFNIYQDTTGDGKWWIERIPTSLELIKDENSRFKEQNGFPLYKNLGQVETSQAFSNGASRTARNIGFAGDPGEYTLEQIVEGINLQDRRDADSVTKLECWGWIPKSVVSYPADEGQMRHIIIAGDVVIYDEPMPPGPMPYWNVPCVPIPHSLYGDSVLSYVGDMIERRSQIENMRSDEVMLNVYGQYWRHARANIKGSQRGRYPGGIITVDPDDPSMRMADLFGVMPRQPVLQESYIESGQKEQQINQVSGSTEPFMGQSFGSHTSATEAGMIGNLGTGRVRLAVTWLNEVFKKPALEKSFLLYQNRMDQDQVVKLDGGLAGGINMSDLAYDIDIYVDSGKFGSLDQNQIQAIVQAMQIAAQIPNGDAAIDLIKAIDEIAVRSGISTRITRTEEEANAIIQQRQQQELLQAQLGATQGQSQ